jgi:hypothetical protein
LHSVGGQLIIEHVMSWAATSETGVKHQMLLIEENQHSINRVVAGYNLSVRNVANILGMFVSA